MTIIAGYNRRRLGGEGLCQPAKPGREEARSIKGIIMRRIVTHSLVLMVAVLMALVVCSCKKAPKSGAGGFDPKVDGLAVAPLPPMDQALAKRIQQTHTAVTSTTDISSEAVEPPPAPAPVAATPAAAPAATGFGAPGGFAATDPNRM
jgi:hypothetical protein